MPRSARLDASGVLHHVMIRGIERGKIFKDDADRDNLLERLGSVLSETQTECYAWALISIRAIFLSQLAFRTAQPDAQTPHYLSGYLKSPPQPPL